MKEYLKFKRSFTLIELLVVIAIIGLLSSVILVSLSGPRQKAKITKALEFSQSVQHAIGIEAVGVWDFDDCTAKDLSGYKNNGTINGAICVDDTPYKLVGSGQGKNALSFDGNDDYVEVPNGTGAPFRQSSQITYSFWANIPSGGGGNVMGAGCAGGQGYGGISLNLDTFAFYWTPTTPVSDRYIFNNQSMGISAGTWNYFVVVMDYIAQTRAMYINGNFISTNMSGSASNWIPTSSFNSGQTDSIGARFINSWFYFKGSIDSVHIYSTALSVYEIQQRYLAGLETHQQLTIK